MAFVLLQHRNNQDGRIKANVALGAVGFLHTQCPAVPCSVQQIINMQKMQEMHKVEHAIHISHISTFVPIKHIRHIGIVHPPGALENAIHVNITPVARRFVSDFILHDKAQTSMDLGADGKSVLRNSRMPAGQR